MNEERLIELETKFAYQEKSLDELNKVIYSQQKQIDQIEKALKTIVSKVKDSADQSSLSKDIDEKPPHYWE